MGRTRVKIVFESDELSPMELLDYFQAHVLDQLGGDVEITDYKALDWRGRTCSETADKVENDE